MASKGSHQQQSADGLAKKDDQELVARAKIEIPELRRGYSVPRDRYLASDLPPLHTLADIFADMASKALELGFASVLFRLGSRPLRVATMCSGTEAPLLALELIQTSKSIDCFLFDTSVKCALVFVVPIYLCPNSGGQTGLGLVLTYRLLFLHFFSHLILEYASLLVFLI